MSAADVNRAEYSASAGTGDYHWPGLVIMNSSPLGNLLPVEIITAQKNAPVGCFDAVYAIFYK